MKLADGTPIRSMAHWLAARWLRGPYDHVSSVSHQAVDEARKDTIDTCNDALTGHWFPERASVAESMALYDDRGAK